MPAAIERTEMRWSSISSSESASLGLLTASRIAARSERAPSLLEKLDRSAGIATGVLLTIIAVFELTSLDVWVQDALFDFQHGRWVLTYEAVVPRLLFYDGPKLVTISLGGTLLALLLGPARWRESRRWRLSRRTLLCAVL